VRKRRVRIALFLAVNVVLAAPRLALAQQKADPTKIERARGMLRDARDLVKKYYYDPKYHGIDLDARYQQYDDRIAAVPSFNEGLRLVAGFLEGLKDSHTYVIPPDRPYRFDYGFRMQLFGDDAFITRTRPGTDAESKVHPGDQVLAYVSNPVNRDDFTDVQFLFNSLMPRTETQLDLRDPDGNVRRVSINTKVRQEKVERNISPASADYYKLLRESQEQDHVRRQQQRVMGDVVIWKMPTFVFPDSEVDHYFDAVRGHKTLILDLRGNPGGLSLTLDRMLANVFDHDVKIADRIGRKDSKPEVAKAVHHPFTGRLIVLVDSSSASAAELFARVIQLEHRGTVIGDRSSGHVMESGIYPCKLGLDTELWYAFSVTAADLIMKDGNSLEHVGVKPDELLLPTPKDLSAGQDPVLAHAAELAGVSLDPDAAGKMFPFEWLPF
jgi:C-terminal processing protease CtpA/Prc